MKFGIFRTNNIDSKTKPCDSAIENKSDDDNDPKWIVEINSLNDLMELRFLVKHPLILCTWNCKDCIEIYDNYRE